MGGQGAATKPTDNAKQLFYKYSDFLPLRRGKARALQAHISYKVEDVHDLQNQVSHITHP